MPKSPTQNTLDKWRKAGYMVQVVERWNSHARIRQDLFGFIDVLAVGNGETVGIQSTSRGNISSRLRKIQETHEEGLYALRDAQWRIIVEGWDKPKHRWRCKEVDIS